MTIAQMEFVDHDNRSIAPATAPHPLAILAGLVERGGDIGAIERMSALAERWQENESKQAYARAMTGFQSEVKPIAKRRETKGGKMTFKYAALDDIMGQIKPLLTKYGISVTYDLAMVDGMMQATCRVRVGSYSEATTLPVPIPKEMVVGDTQKYGAAVSYAKRYALCAALNLVTTGEDDERNLMEFVNDTERVHLRSLLQRAGRDSDDGIASFLQWAKADTLDEVTITKYREAEKMLAPIIAARERAKT